VYEFPLGYNLAGELGNVLDIIHHSLDYWVECWLPKNVSIGRMEDQIIAQVGLTESDHNITNWVLPEDNIQDRPVIVIKGKKIQYSCPNSGRISGFSCVFGRNFSKI